MPVFIKNLAIDLMDHNKYKILSQFFKALAHPTRLMIINELLDRKICVNDIEELLELKQSNISQHLNLLRLLNIVDFIQDGNKKCYFLNNPELIKNLLGVVKGMKATQTGNTNKNRNNKI